MRSFQSKLFLAALILAGCAAYPAPTEQLERAERMISGALEAEAARLAAADIASAQEKMKLARRLIAASKYQEARWLAEQAQADAELAAAKSVSARALREASRQAEEFRQSNRRTALNTH